MSLWQPDAKRQHSYNDWYDRFVGLENGDRLPNRKMICKNKSYFTLELYLQDLEQFQIYICTYKGKHFHISKTWWHMIFKTYEQLLLRHLQMLISCGVLVNESVNAMVSFWLIKWKLSFQLWRRVQRHVWNASQTRLEIFRDHMVIP